MTRETRGFKEYFLRKAYVECIDNHVITIKIIYAVNSVYKYVNIQNINFILLWLDMFTTTYECIQLIINR